MMKSVKSQTLNLKLILRAIESFFYKIRFNIALYRTLHSREHNSICNKIREAIYKQILHIATVEKINLILGITKADKKEAETRLEKYWIPLLAILDEEGFYQYIVSSANRGGQAGMDKLRVNETFKLKDKKLLDAFKVRVKEAAILIDQTTKQWLVDKVLLGEEKDLASIDIAKYIRSFARDYSLIRAELIAEEEAIRAFGGIEAEFYKRNKVDFHRWLTSRDELVCKDCVANEEAGTIPVGELFPGGVVTTPQHYRCRCILLPMPKEEVKIKWIG